MSYIIAGLGNPGEKYERTRHNTGRIVLQSLTDEGFSFNKKINALIGETKIGKDKVKLVSPETFMNNSGKSLVYLVKNVKSAEKLVVIYDDFNLPLGKIRISFDRGSGGHNGIESIARALKTKAFIRIRIGVSPTNAKGIAKVPHGDEKIEKFILGNFKEDEMKELKKVMKKIPEILEVVVNEGREKAMSLYN